MTFISMQKMQALRNSQGGKKDIFTALVVFFAFSCSPPKEVAFELSPYFADSIPYPQRNKFTPEGIALGKRLFFEAKLSANNQISCATCHLPDFAFSDTSAKTNKGLSGKKLARNTPTLLNIAWANKGLFWDGGAADIESLVFAPLTHPDEMGQDLKKLPQKLLNTKDYRALFYQAFHQDTITNALIARALAQYVRTLTSEKTKYDLWVQNKIQFSKIEIEGYEIFKQKCANCHLPPLFSDHDFHKISEQSNDFFLGRFRITADSTDIGKFKTPNLRNLSLTAPYLHDGSAESIEIAIKKHTQNIPKLTEKDIKLLLIFLNTLN